MHKLKYLTISITLLLLLSVVGPSFDVAARPLADTTPDLGAVNRFAVFADTLISSAGNTSTINGDVGLEDGTGAAIGVRCAEVGTFSIFDRDNAYTGAGGGSVTCFAQNAGLLGTADTNLITAYDRLEAADNAACDTDVAGVDDLSLRTPLGPGVYCATAFIITGNLVLSGSAADIWIFRSASTIDTDPGVTVSGPASCSIWWRAATSVTIGTSNTFDGNILALDSISDDGSSTINGRLLARNGAVTLINTTVNRGPLCVTQSDTTAPTAVPPSEEEASSSRFSVSGLPNTGGAPIRNEDFPWSLVIVAGLSAIALGLGLRSYRRKHLPKQ